MGKLVFFFIRIFDAFPVENVERDLISNIYVTYITVIQQNS